MTRQLILSREPFDEAALLAGRKLTPEMGAVVCFIGVVRGIEGEVAIRALEYEAFERMAEHQFALLFDQLAARWPVSSVRLAHRLGSVPVSEPSFWLEIVAPHRTEAFAAAQWLIDEMKQVVPIWKRPIQ